MKKKIKPLQSSFEVAFVKRMLIFLMIMMSSAFVLALFIPGPMQEKSYMGAEYCGTCHQEIYKSWAKSPHKDAGVTCETCHGPGEKYASVHVKKDLVLRQRFFFQTTDINTCRHCHSHSANLWSKELATKLWHGMTL